MHHPSAPTAVVVPLPVGPVPRPGPSLGARLWSTFTTWLEERIETLTEDWETPFLYDGLDDESDWTPPPGPYSAEPPS